MRRARLAYLLRSKPSCALALTTSMPEMVSSRPALSRPKVWRSNLVTGLSWRVYPRTAKTCAVMNTTGTSSISHWMSPMKINGTMIASVDSRIRLAPGVTMSLSWPTSSVARAITSPTRRRSCTAWLLPSKLAYSSNRALAASPFATFSAVKAAAMFTTPSITSAPRMARLSSSKVRTASGPGLRMTSTAQPTNTGADE